MPLLKSFVVVFAHKEGRHALYFKFHMEFAGKLFNQEVQSICYIRMKVHCRAHGSKKMGVLRSNDVFLIQV